MKFQEKQPVKICGQSSSFQKIKLLLTWQNKQVVVKP